MLSWIKFEAVECWSILHSLQVRLHIRDAI